MKKIFFTDIYDLTDSLIFFLFILFLFIILFSSSFILFNLYLVLEFGICGTILAWIVNFNIYIPIYNYFFDYFNLFKYSHIGGINE